MRPAQQNLPERGEEREKGHEMHQLAEELRRAAEQAAREMIAEGGHRKEFDYFGARYVIADEVLDGEHFAVIEIGGREYHLYLNGAK